MALHRQGRLRDAEKIYMRVLKAAPDHFDALNLLGTVKAQLGRIGEAHRLLTAAVKLNPRAAQAMESISARCSMQLKHDQDALGCSDKALRSRPATSAFSPSRQRALEFRPCRGSARRIPRGFSAGAATSGGAAQQRHCACRARRA